MATKVGPVGNTKLSVNKASAKYLASWDCAKLMQLWARLIEEVAKEIRMRHDEKLEFVLSFENDQRSGADIVFIDCRKWKKELLRHVTISFGECTIGNEKCLFEELPKKVTLALMSVESIVPERV